MANIVDILLKIKDQASGKLGQFREELAKTGSAGKLLADNLGKFSLVGVAAGFKSLASSVVASTSKLADVGNTLRTVSTSSGQTIETIQALRLAAERSSIPVGQVDRALVRFSESLGKAALNGGKAEESFNRIGVSIRDNNGVVKDQEELFIEVTDALSLLGDSAEKSAISQELFGYGAQGINQLMKDGSTALSEYTQQLSSYGALTDETIAKLDKFQDVQNQIADIQRQMAIENVDAAIAVKQLGLVWSEGLNSVAKALTGLLPLEDKNLTAMIEQAEHRKNLALAVREISEMYEEKEVPAIQKTIEELAKERKEIEATVKAKLKESEATEKQAKARQQLKNDIQDQIDALKAAQATGIEKVGLEKGIEERRLESDVAKLREKGADEAQIEELTKLRRAQIETEHDWTKEVGESVAVEKEATEATESLTESTKKLADATEETTKRVGGLADAFSGGDRASGGTNERLIFSPAFRGLANSAEDLNRQFDRARAASVAEILRDAQTGQLELSEAEHQKFLNEFEQLTKRTGEEFGRIREFTEGTGRQGAFFGESRININFNPHQDYDNMSQQSQRQLAEEIGAVMRMR